MLKIRCGTFSLWLPPLVLLALCVLSFGLLIPYLGYYFDDWPKILVGRFWGLGGYWAYYAGDRPLSSWTHILFTPILGYKPVYWHVFTLLLRWLTSVGVWWWLRHLWPDRSLQALLTAAVFLVHPFFTQQAIPVTYFQQWLQYALFVFAMGAMTQSVRQPNRFLLWSGLSLAASLVQLTITEYFAVLEFLRLPMLWFLIGEEGGALRQRFTRTLRLWLPYLALILAFLLWRLLLLRFPGDEDPYRPELLYSLLYDAAALVRLARIMGVDTLYVLIAHWSRVIGLGLSPVPSPLVFLSWGAGLFSALLMTAYLLRGTADRSGDCPAPTQRVWQALVLGLLAFVFGCAPAWLSERVVIEGYRSDRYALPALLGASLLTTVLIDWAVQRRVQKAAVFSLLLGLSIAFNFQIGNHYRWQNIYQNRFFWQLYWRAPYIEPGTAILMEKDVFPDLGLFSLSAAVNLIYPPPQGEERLSYWVYTLLPKYAGQSPDPNNIAFFTRFRSLVFEGSTPQTLLMHYDAERANCWWMLSPQDDVNPYLPSLVKRMLAASHLERILPAPVSADYPPADLFGREPEHGWCYYYQKADLARQTGDWQKAADLADQVLLAGYAPQSPGSNSPHEWMPFIEAYAHVGDWEKARTLTLSSYETDREYGDAFCSLWSRINNETAESEAKTENREWVLSTLGCSY